MNARDLTMRTLRVVLGIGVAAALFAAAGLLGFVGLWTFAGFKSPGDPSRGLLALAAGVGAFATGGMTLAWTLGARSRRVIGGVGVGFAVVAVAITLWFVNS